MRRMFFLICLSTALCNVIAQRNLPSVKVTGDIQQPITLYERDIASMKRSVVTLQEQNGIKYTYTGVSLQEILKQAGADNALNSYLLARGADGFEAVLSAAELDSAFSGKIIILADQINGKPLPKGLGPFRLIVPGEENRIRWLWEINTLIVKHAEE